MNLTFLSKTVTEDSQQSSYQDYLQVHLKTDKEKDFNLEYLLKHYINMFSSKIKALWSDPLENKSCEECKK